MDTIGLDGFHIAYSAIPRCANTSIKLSLFALKTGTNFEKYDKDGPLWPHAIPKLGIHRSDIIEFTNLTHRTIDFIEENYEFWFTVVDSPLRRLFSAYQMLVLLEDPHLRVMARDTRNFANLATFSYESIKAHFEDFVNSTYLKYLMEVDAHFIPQAVLLNSVITSNKLQVYGLNEISRIETELNEFLQENRIKRRFEVSRSNNSLLNIRDIAPSLECQATIKSLYRRDIQMLQDRGVVFTDDVEVPEMLKEENLLNIAMEAIRDRNRQIFEMYERYIEKLNSLGKRTPE